MIKNKIYKDFCDHTGLSDVVYETIFNKIEENLYRINDLKWLYFTYSDKDNDVFNTVNFSKDKTIPLYIVELIKNIFGNYYTLPSSVVVSLGIIYKGKEYNIICNAEGTEIPEEVSFLRDTFNLFFMTHPVRDIFEEYDNTFNFINKFKTSIKNIFPALEKKFTTGETSSDYLKEDEKIDTKSLIQEKMLIQSLEDKISMNIAKLDQIRAERENAEKDKEILFSSVNNRDALLQERNKFKIELEMLSDSSEVYQDRMDRLETILNKIDSELSYAIDNSGSQEDVSFLKEKKIVFSHEKTSLTKSINDINLLIRTASNNSDILNKELSRIEDYKNINIDDIEKKIEDLAKFHADTYKDLVVTEAKLKDIKSKNLEKQLKVEKAQTYTDTTIQNIENNSIVSHLSTPLQPSSVTIVSNYLRQYFGYYTTQLSNSLLEESPDSNIYIIQAMATRLCLLRYFGLTFNILFTVFPIADDNIKNSILILKDI